MKPLLSAVLLALASLPSLASAQVSLQVQLVAPFPPRPEMVVVQPGIQVVAGHPEEVFLVGSYYWLRRDAAWYRSMHPMTGFVYVAPHRVPVGLTHLPPGHYRNYTKAQAKADRLARKAEEKSHRHDAKSRHGR